MGPAGLSWGIQRPSITWLGTLGLQAQHENQELLQARWSPQAGSRVLLQEGAPGHPTPASPSDRCLGTALLSEHRRGEPKGPRRWTARRLARRGDGVFLPERGQPPASPQRGAGCLQSTQGAPWLRPSVLFLPQPPTRAVAEKSEEQRRFLGLVKCVWGPRVGTPRPATPCGEAVSVPSQPPRAQALIRNPLSSSLS